MEIVEVVDYDESWPTAFERERQVLLEAIGNFVVGSIEHVGSTSIPALAAKSIVDIQVGVAGLDESRPAFGPLEAIRYCYDTVRPNDMHFFDKREQGKQPYNLQLIPYRSDCWNMRIAFRDYLRSHAGAANEYAALKRELVQRFNHDIKAYTEAKSSFILRIAREAMDCVD